MRIILLLLLSTSFLFSTSFYELDPLVSTQSCVHTLSGEFHLYQEDRLTENIVLYRVYRDQVWKYSPHTELILKGRPVKSGSKKKKKKKKKSEDTFIYDEVQTAAANGCPLVYQLDDSIYRLVLPIGFTNTARGELNALGNLRNKTLKRLDTFTFIMSCPDGTERTFIKSYSIGHDMHYLLQSEKLPNGQMLRYEYDQKQRIHALRCGKESAVFHYYSDYDFDITTSKGTTFVYRSQNNLLCQAEGPSIDERFTYQGNQIQLVKWTDKAPFRVEYTRDNKVRAIKNEQGEALHTFSYFSNRTEVLHRENTKTIYYYTSHFLPETIEQLTSRQTTQETIKFNWNPFGELTSKTVYNSMGSLVFAQSYEYDRLGNPVIENYNGKIIRREFDSLCRVITETSDDSFQFCYLGETNLLTEKIRVGKEQYHYEYDEKMVLKKIEIFDTQRNFKREIELTGGPNWPTEVIEKVGGTIVCKTQYHYQKKEALEKIFHPNGQLLLERTIARSEIKRPWEILYHPGVSRDGEWEIERDYFDRVTARRKKGAGGLTLSEEKWEYNPVFLTAYKDPQNTWFRYEYRKNGQKEKETITFPNGKKKVLFFDHLARITKELADDTFLYHYLGDTNLITKKIRQGKEEYSYSYTNDKLLRQVVVYDPQKNHTRTIDLEGNPDIPSKMIEKADGKIVRITTYSSPSDGILVEEVYNPDGTKILSHTINENQIRKPWLTLYGPSTIRDGDLEIEKDHFERVIAKRKKSPSGETLLEERWEYDALFLRSHTDQTGLTRNYQYNLKGQREKEILETSLGTLETLFTCDDRGRIEKKRVGDLITCYSYDQQDRILTLSEEDLEGNLISKVFFNYNTDPPSITQQMTRGAITYPMQQETPSPDEEYIPGAQKVYNELGQLIELYTDDGTIHYTIEYNKWGHPTKYIDLINEQRGTLDYDEMGNLISETFGNGLSLKNTYDLRGRKTELILPDDSHIFYRWGPKYLDEIYRIAHRGKYQYRHRFMQYDLCGFPTKQRLIEGFGELSYILDSSMQVAAVHTRYFDQVSNLPYTGDFPTTTKPYIYKTDSLGRIVEIEQPNRFLRFTYDVWNRRLTKRVWEKKEDEWEEVLSLGFLYDKEKEIGAMDLEDNWLRQLRVLAPHPINTGDQAVAYELEGLPYAPIYDLYGNVVTLLSVIRGKVMESYTYSPHGRDKITDIWNEVLPNSKAFNPWRFGCYRVDEETGLLSIDRAFYDPQQRSFLTKPDKQLPQPQLFAVPRSNI